MQFLVALEAAFHVLVASVIVGASLPTLYGLGVRQLAASGHFAESAPVRARVHRVAASLLFILTILIVVVGLGYIIAHGFGVEVTFDGLRPVISR